MTSSAPGSNPITSAPRGFVQIQRLAVSSLLSRPHATVVWLALALHADWETRTAFPSYARLRRETGLSFATIAKALHDVKRLGLVDIRKMPGRVTVYTVNGLKCGLSPLHGVKETTSQDEGHPFTGRSAPLHGVKTNVEVKNEDSINEENNNPAPPARVGVNGSGFDSFWTAYPRKCAKHDALKAWQKLHPDAALLAAILKAIDVQKTSESWTKDGGRFIPYPASWLNSRRWEDEVGPRRVRGVEIQPGKFQEVCSGPAIRTDA